MTTLALDLDIGIVTAKQFKLTLLTYHIVDIYRVFRYLRPPSTADVNIDTYENCIFP